MRLRLRVTRNAQHQIREAAGWWAENRRAAPDLFSRELQRGFELVTTQPEIGAVAKDGQLRGVRRLHLFRIRYQLYYRTANDTVEVLALWHTSRGESPEL